jgi:hypothetical protein
MIDFEELEEISLCLFKILSQIFPGIIQYLICYVLLMVGIVPEGLLLFRHIVCARPIKPYKRVSFYSNRGCKKDADPRATVSCRLSPWHAPNKSKP